MAQLSFTVEMVYEQILQENEFCRQTNLGTNAKTDMDVNEKSRPSA